MVTVKVNHTNNGGDTTSSLYTFDPTTGEVMEAGREGTQSEDTSLQYIVVAPPTDEYERVEFLEFEPYASKFHDIDNQTTKAHNNIENFANNTYTKYQTGAINNSDLLDPYLVQRDYAPNGSFQAWSTMSLTLMGANTPENVDSVGHFKITAGSAQYKGMLLSDESPASGCSRLEPPTTLTPSTGRSTW